jgi:vacuolar-type H+-ATPase subunit I/STV1
MKIKIEAENNRDISNENTQKEEQNKEPEKVEKKEYHFKDILDRAFDLKDKVQDAREIKDLDLDEKFLDMRDTALKLVENVESKADLINLASDEIKSLDLKESKAVNMMLDNGLKIDGKESIIKFVGVLKNIQELTAGDPSLDFESVLKNVVSQLKTNQNQLSQGKERE